MSTTFEISPTATTFKSQWAMTKVKVTPMKMKSRKSTDFLNCLKKGLLQRNKPQWTLLLCPGVITVNDNQTRPEAHPIDLPVPQSHQQLLSPGRERLKSDFLQIKDSGLPPADRFCNNYADHGKLRERMLPRNHFY
jgi:hypothetical protein